MEDPGGRALRDSYDAVAARYADAIGGELAPKVLDRALLAAFVELTEGGTIADVGCGPGHVAAWLAARGARVVGVDLSEGMIEVARSRHPGPEYRVGSMLALPLDDGGLRGALALYAIIHLDDAERELAMRELARVLEPNGWLLLAFHVADAEHRPGDVLHLTEWMGEAVDVRFRFLAPDAIVASLEAAGFALHARVEREPVEGAEHPSARCMLLARRR